MAVAVVMGGSFLPPAYAAERAPTVQPIAFHAQVGRSAPASLRNTQDAASMRLNEMPESVRQSLGCLIV
ncbi:MAG: hypothetical protein K2X44_12615, partial [Magnetospirillum sp.]|nr:hypothetical protein [Magnetospirillum sp.]